MKKIALGLLSISLLMLISSFSLDTTKNKLKSATVHCFEFRVTCAGRTGFYDTVQAASWGEATKMINAKYPNCKATQVKQKDC